MLHLSPATDLVKLGNHPGSILHVANGTCSLARVGSSMKAYQVRGSRLKSVWSAENVFGDGALKSGSEGEFDAYPFFAGDLLNTGNEDIVIWRSDGGVKAAQLVTPLGSSETAGSTPFKAVFRTDTRFQDIYGWRQQGRTFLWDFFYGNQSFGLFTRDEVGGPRFYILSKSGLRNRLPSYFKEVTEVKVGLAPEWSSDKTEILLEKLGSGGGSRDSFLLWGPQGLSVYKFQGKNLELQLKAPGIIKKDKGDKLFVGDILDSRAGGYMDILVSSAEGLQVFRYNSGSRGYALASSYSESGSLYWKSLYGHSAMLVDVNGDGKQEVAFNGPQGITAISLEAVDSNSVSGNLGSIYEWKHVLIPEKFGRPLAFLGSSLFFREESGTLQMGKLEETRECPRIPGFSPLDQVVEEGIRTLGGSAIPSASGVTQVSEHRVGFSSKPILRWMDRWELAQILKDTVHLPTAQARFSVPLAELKFSTDLDFNVGLDYRSEENLEEREGADDEGAILGHGGWRLATPREYIMAERGNGGLPAENGSFYFVAGADYRQLEAEEGAPSTWSVKIAGVRWNLIYDPAREEWSAKSDNESRAYGANGAARRGLYWPRWTGSTGSDFGRLEERVEMWYMTERRDVLSQKAIKFRYLVESDNLESPHQSKRYTTAVHLQSVESGATAKVEFDLRTKPIGEYKKHNPVQLKDDKKTISFPARQQNKLYLNGVTILTPNYRQTLSLSYTTSSKGRYLSKISQKEVRGSLDEDLFNFRYDRSGQLVGVTGTSFSVDYKYDTAKISPPSYITIAEASHDKIIPISTANLDNVKVARGKGFTAVAFKPSQDNLSIRLKIFDETLEKELTASQNYLSGTPAAQQIKDFQVMTMDRCVLILENFSEERKLLRVFCQTSLEDRTQWSHQWTSDILSKDVTLSWAREAFGFCDKGGSHVTFGYTNGGSPFKLSRAPVPGVIKNMVLMSSRSFIIYNGSEVKLHSMGPSGNWEERTILSGVTSDEHRWIHSMKMKPSDRATLLENIRSFQFQVAKNAVQFLRHHFDGNLVTSTAYLSIIGKSIDHTQTFSLGSQRMTDLTKEVSLDFGEVTLKYRMKNGVYTPYCTDISGSKFEQKAKEDLKEHYESHKSEYNTNSIKSLTEEFEKMESPPLPIKFRILQLSPEGHVIELFGKDKLKVFARMEGDSWVSDGSEKRKDADLQEYAMGEDFKLEVGPSGNANMTGYTFRRKDTGAKLWSFKLNKWEGDQMAFGFPNYAAYQTGNGGDIHVVPISKDPLMDSGNEARRQHLRGEKLMGSSDATWLITLSNGDLIFRRSAEFIPQREKTIRVLTESTLSSGGYSLTRKFDTSFRWQRRNLRERKVEMSYGAGRSIHGWLEQSTMEDVLSFEGNSTSTQKWYDGKSSSLVLSKSQQLTLKDKEKEDDKKVTSAPTAIKDISGKWVIADIAPYTIAHQMYGFLGFEPYENPGANWAFPTGNVARDDAFPLTGQSYLRLSSGEKVSGVFTPTDKTATYIVSTWMKWTTPVYVEKGVALSAKVIFQPGNIHMLTLQSQVKKEGKDGWTYLELMVDLDTMNKLYSEFFQVKKREFLDDIFAQNATSTRYPNPSEAQCSLAFSVSNEQGGSADIHVDHIRFHPGFSDFTVTVFQNDTILYTPPSDENEVPAPPAQNIILGNGEILTKLYDPAGTQEIAAVQETGEVEQLSSSGNLRPGGPSRVGRSTVQFSPEVGFHESFDPASFQTRWDLDNPVSFKVSRGQLWHTGNGDSSGSLSLKSQSLRLGATAAIRLRYHFVDQSSQITLNWVQIFKALLQNSGSTTQIKIGGSRMFEVPKTGEVIVYLGGGWAMVWSEGQLLGEFRITGDSQRAWEAFSIEFKGPGKNQIQDLILLSKPEVTVQYFNIWGLQMQTIKLENSGSAQVMETLYDEVGREAIRTKATRISRGQQGVSCLLCFQDGFVTNGAPQASNSVFRTGRLEGLVNTLNPGDEGYPYWRTVYEASPLEEKLCESSPGKGFTCESPFVTRTPRNSDLARLFNLFPPSEGFREKVKVEPNGSTHVRIFNNEGKEVAHYVHVPGHDHLLATHEFDQGSGQITRILPPQYHAEMDTMGRLTPWKFGMSPNDFTPDELELQRKWHTRFSYDDQGNMIGKEIPDAETRHYLYDKWGNMRFNYGVINGATPRIAKDISFFLYTDQRQLAESGTVTKAIPESKLKQYLHVAGVPPPKRTFQKMDHFDLHPDPELRGRLRTIMTFNEGWRNSTNDGSEDDPPFVLESLRFNEQNAVVAKKCSSSSSPDGPQLARKIYRGGRLQTLVYPTANPINGERLQLVHSYDGAGNLIGLGTPEEPLHFAQFNWLPGGVLEYERILPNSGCGNGFVRNFRYNSPGHLVQISDPFITQDMEYTGGGYGQNGFGDGIVMRTTFNASWASMKPNHAWFHINPSTVEEDIPMLRQICVGALQRLGFLSKNGEGITPLKILTKADFSSLPGKCSGRTGIQLMEMLSRKMPPGGMYGHAYTYGNHKELVKAKYFDRDQDISKGPLMPSSFSEEVVGLKSQDAIDIWDGLKDLNIINTEQHGNDTSGATGWGRLTDVLGEDNLARLLDNGEADLGALAGQIINIVMEKHGGPQLSNDDLYQLILSWKGGLDVPLPQALLNNIRQSADVAYQVLQTNGYLSRGSQFLTKVLSPTLRQLLNGLSISSNVKEEIVKVLLSHFAQQLGEGPYDLESCKIDANGNHGEFVVGQERWELLYERGTNKISEIHVRNAETFGEPGDAKIVHKIEHDSQGNVSKAPHLKVKLITYHPMSNRPIKFELEDGRLIELEYDAAGERNRKCVKDSTGRILYDLHYFRDEKGKVLLDHRMEYDNMGTEIIRETRTTYVYGTRGYLLGFLRNNKFFAVHTDHSGSSRLVTEGGRVVAAYDYLPYGQLMRVFGDEGRVSSEGHLIYRYSAQEWDEETGLYNFHSRLYDPSIGRFLQMDPKGQYWSPYKFAGNSPVSFTDPDGQFAFLIACIVGAVVGAYLGGAAANGTYNPAKWKWNTKTALAMVGGGIAGAFFPVAIKASIAAVGLKATLAIGGAFSAMNVAAKVKANPNLKWYSPELVYGAFEGFSTGVSLVGGVGTLHHFAGKMGTFGKYALLTTSYATGAGLAYHGVAQVHGGNYRFWKWDKFFEPESIMAAANGFDAGSGWPLNFKQMAKGSAKLFKRTSSFVKMGKAGAKLILKSNNASLKSFLKSAAKFGANQKFRRDALKAGGIMISTYYHISAANGDFDPSKWDLHSFSTYEGALNGIFFGKDIKNSLTYIRDVSKTPKSKSPGSMNSLKQFVKEVKGAFKTLGKQMNTKNYKGQIRLVERILSKSPAVLAAVKVAMRNGASASSTGGGDSSSTLPRVIRDVDNVAVRNQAESGRIFGDADMDTVVGLRRQDDAETIRLADDDDASRIKGALEEEGFLKCGGGGGRRKRGLKTTACVPKTEGVDAIFKGEKEDIVQKSGGGTSILITLKDAVGHRVDNPSKKVRVDDFIKGKLDSGDVHKFSVDDPGPRNLAMSEELAQFFQEIPSKTLATGSVPLQAVKGMLDGASLGKTGKDVFVAKTLDKVTIDGTEVDLLHAYVKDGDKLSLKSFLAVEEKVVGNSGEGIPIPNLDNSVRSHMNRLKLPQDFAGKTVDSTVYIMYKERKPPTDGGGGGVATHVLAMTPAVRRPTAGATPTLDTIRFPEAPNKSPFNGLDDFVVKKDNELVKNRRAAIEELEYDLDRTVLNRLSDNVLIDLATKKVAMEDFMVKMVDSFEKGKLRTSSGAIEADFQGYVYGAMRLDMARKLELNMRPEMIAGKGYLDIGGVSHVSAEGTSNWGSRVPFVMELKYTRDSSLGSVTNALGQINRKKYANNLFLRHSSEFVILVAANPLGSRNMKVLVQVARLPEPTLVSDQILHAGRNRGGFNEATIKKGLDWMDGTTSNLAEKGPHREYSGARLLGGLSRIPEGALGNDGMRLYLASASRDLGAPASTRVLGVWEGSKRMLDLNFLERKETTRGSIDPLPRKTVQPDGVTDGFQVTKIGIEVDPYSNQKKNAEFWGKVRNEEVILGRDNSLRVKDLPELELIRSDQLLAGERGEWKKVFGNFDKLKDIFTSESNVQAYLHGLLEEAPMPKGAHPDLQIVRSVWMEANPNRGGRVDLLVRTHEINKVTEEVTPESQKVTAIEIKLLSDNDGKRMTMDKSLEEAQQQNRKYGEYSVLTDATKVSQLTVVFDGRTGVTGQRGTFGIREADVGHWSAKPSPLMTPSDIDLDIPSLDIGPSRSGPQRGHGTRRKRDVQVNQAPLWNVTGTACLHQNHHQPPMVSSGGTTIHSSWLGLPLKRIRKILGSSIDYVTSSLLSSPWTPNQENESEDVQNESGRSDSESDQTRGGMTHCQEGAWNGDGYSMEAITCRNPLDGSSAMVFSKLGSDVEALVSSSHQPILLGDNYAKNACQPLEFNGRPSVTCSGEKSDFVYTPGPSYFNKTFDNVDGHIMLGALVLKKIYSAFLDKADDYDADTDPELFADDEDETEEMGPPQDVQNLKEELTKLDQFLEKIDIKLGWAANILEDLHDDLDSDPKAHSSLTTKDMESMKERLGALWEDVLEEIQLMSREEEGLPARESRQAHDHDSSNEGVFLPHRQTPFLQLQNVWGAVSGFRQSSSVTNVQ